MARRCDSLDVDWITPGTLRQDRWGGNRRARGSPGRKLARRFPIGNNLGRASRLAVWCRLAGPDRRQRI